MSQPWPTPGMAPILTACECWPACECDCECECACVRVWTCACACECPNSHAPLVEIRRASGTTRTGAGVPAAESAVGVSDDSVAEASACGPSLHPTSSHRSNEMHWTRGRSSQQEPSTISHGAAADGATVPCGALDWPALGGRSPSVRELRLRFETGSGSPVPAVRRRFEPAPTEERAEFTEDSLDPQGEAPPSPCRSLLFVCCSLLGSICSVLTTAFVPTWPESATCTPSAASAAPASRGSALTPEERGARCWMLLPRLPLPLVCPASLRLPAPSSFFGRVRTTWRGQPTVPRASAATGASEAGAGAVVASFERSYF